MPHERHCTIWYRANAHFNSPNKNPSFGPSVRSANTQADLHSASHCPYALLLGATSCTAPLPTAGVKGAPTQRRLLRHKRWALHTAAVHVATHLTCPNGGDPWVRSKQKLAVTHPPGTDFGTLLGCPNTFSKCDKEKPNAPDCTCHHPDTLGAATKALHYLIPAECLKDTPNRTVVLDAISHVP